MSEDAYCGYEQANSLHEFDEQLILATMSNGRLFKPERQPRSFRASYANYLDDIEEHIQQFRKTIGRQLVMASRYTTLEALTGLKTRGTHFSLLGSDDGDREADGYLITPAALIFVRHKQPDLSLLVLDNIPPADPWRRIAETSAYCADEEEGKGYDLINLQQGHNPLLIFPWSSVYANPVARQVFIDNYCNPDIPVYRKA